MGQEGGGDREPSRQADKLTYENVGAAFNESMLIREWDALDNENKPAKYAELLRLIKLFLDYPSKGQFSPSEIELHDIGKRLDRTFDLLTKAAKAVMVLLNEVVPHDYILRDIMKPRVVGSRAHQKTTLAALDQLEQLVPLLSNIGPREHKKGNRATNGVMRHLVAVIAWYIIAVEKRPYTRTFDTESSEPKSRAAIITATTLKAMGIEYPPSSLKSHMESVVRTVEEHGGLPDWYSMEMAWPPLREASK